MIILPCGKEGRKEGRKDFGSQWKSLEGKALGLRHRSSTRLDLIATLFELLLCIPFCYAELGTLVNFNVLLSLRVLICKKKKKTSKNP